MKRNLHALFSVFALFAGFAARPSRAEPASDGLYAGFTTSKGEFWCRLEFQRAPRTTANFVSLVEGTRSWIDFPVSGVVRRPFYAGLTFHRVIPGFMIQGGSPNGQGTDGPGYQFADEFHTDLKHSKPGILSMANSGRNSNGSQFFVTVTNTPWLDGVHSIFGEVVEGMENVYAISGVPTGAGSKPLEPVVVQEVRILRRGTAANAFDPAAVTPSLPDVGVVPTAIAYSPTNLTILVQPRAKHFQHVMFGTDLSVWQNQSFKGAVSNINATSLLGQPRVFFRTLDGGYEP